MPHFGAPAGASWNAYFSSHFAGIEEFQQGSFDLVCWGMAPKQISNIGPAEAGFILLQRAQDCVCDRVTD